MKSLKDFLANKTLIIVAVIIVVSLFASYFPSPATKEIKEDVVNTVSSLVSAKAGCDNIEGYKNWLSTNKDTFTPKPYGTEGYLIESINPLGIDYTVYVVTCNERSHKDDEWPMQTQAVLVYSSNSNSFLDFSLMEYYIDFVSTGDVNDNNIDDMQVQMATGGNCWSCEWKEIFEVKDDKVTLLTEGLNYSEGDAQAVKSIEDLDADDISELVVLEAKWVFAFDLCHACSPGTYKIYEWSGTSYEEDKKSEAYFSFHRKNLENSLAWWKEKGCSKSARPTEEDSDTCLPTAMRVLLEYDSLGMRDKGWNFFWNNTNPEFIRKKYNEVSDSIIQARTVLKKQYDEHKEFSPHKIITDLDVEQYFPIKYNSFWVYEGVKNELVEGKMETTESKKYIEVYNTQYSEDGSTIIWLGDGSNYVVRGSTIDFEPQIEPFDKFILTFPLSVGQKWGDKDQLRNRTDGYYVWEVEQKLSQEVLGKKYDECFRIANKMLTGTEYRIFCYGIGIVEEGYKHNGSPLEEVYKLTAYQ